MATADEVYTIPAVARAMGVTEQAVRYRIGQGKLRVTQINGGTVVLQRELDKWRQERLERAAILSR